MDKKILIAYFSVSNKTAKVAKELSSLINADICEIKPKIPYKREDLDWTNENSRSTIEMKNTAMRPAIIENTIEIRQYDVLLIGFPIWWYIAPTIVNTFLERYDLTNKIVIPFATSGGSGMGKTNEMLAGSCKGATLLDGKVLNGKNDIATFKQWIQQHI